MREIHLLNTLFCTVNGITPAYAGNTNFAMQAMKNVWDHPRVCGKYCDEWL